MTTQPAARKVTQVEALKELPELTCMESASTLAEAQAWADRIGRDVYWLASNKTAYAPVNSRSDMEQLRLLAERKL